MFFHDSKESICIPKLAAYARLQAEREDGVFTEQGYLTRNSAFEEVYRGHHDLPDDFKVYENPQPLKLTDTELAGFVLKIHALCGGDSQSASYNLNVLTNLRSAEYLMLMDGRNIFLTEAAHGITVKSGKVAEIVITNPKITEPTTPDDPSGELLLTKKAAGAGKLLPGAVFGIYRASDGVKVAEITTGSGGTAVLSLEPNNYYCVELKAPAGFILDSTRIPFTVKNNATVEVDVTILAAIRMMFLISDMPAITALSIGLRTPCGNIALIRKSMSAPRRKHILTAIKRICFPLFLRAIWLRWHMWR